MFCSIVHSAHIDKYDEYGNTVWKLSEERVDLKLKVRIRTIKLPS